MAPFPAEAATHLTLGREVEAEWRSPGDVATRAGVRVRSYLQGFAITCAITARLLLVID